MQQLVLFCSSWGRLPAAVLAALEVWCGGAEGAEFQGKSWASFCKPVPGTKAEQEPDKKGQETFEAHG